MNWQHFKIDQTHREERHTESGQWRGPARRSYRTVRLGAPTKLKNLHSKIGRRVDFARVRYGTMQSESMRGSLVPPYTLYQAVPDLKGVSISFFVLASV